MATEVPPNWPPSEPPSTPPPPPPPAAQPLPWEDPAYPPLEALYETTKLVLFYPRQAFSRMSTTGSMSRPILFAIILGWVGVAVAQLYQWVFRSTITRLLPGIFGREDTFFAKVGGIVTVITAPVWILLGLALATLVVHFFLLLLGGAQKGLSTTFRTLAYTEATYLFQVLPLVGGVIAVLWWIPIAIVGLAEAHQTTTGRAAGAVLAPLLLCCVCVMVVLLVAGAAIMGALQNLR